MSNLILVCLQTVLVSVHDRCTVCTKHTIVSEIVLDASDDTSLRNHFGLFGDSINLDAR
jgi:hypothetical protein